MGRACSSIVPKSYLYLNNTVLDYHEDLTKQGFVFQNPQATRSCGCGSSFTAEPPPRGHPNWTDGARREPASSWHGEIFGPWQKPWEMDERTFDDNS